jgi:hypothetical protein
MRAITLLAAGFVVGVIGSSVGASPIIDGFANVLEYAKVVYDTPGETAYVGNLDIDTFQFDASNSYYNVALTVMSTPVDKTGGVTSFVGQTEFWTAFYDATGTTPSYYVDVLMNASSVLSFMLLQNGGGGWTPVALTPGVDYDVAVADAIEWRIDKAKMSLLAATPYVIAQLDNRGQAPDDQISTGPIPEPATLALLALGAVATLAVRRRR